MRSTFHWLRRVLWPIERAELGRFVPTFLLGFLICFNYFLLRPIKDTVVVTATSSGAGVIPFLKLWGVLPAVILVTILLSRLFRKLPRSRVFYLVTSGFLIYFALFALVLYPLRDSLRLDALADGLILRLPGNWTAPLEVLRHWSLSLFYVVCELWKIAVLMVCFWGFVNARTNVATAQRLYAPLVLGGSLAGTIAGQVTVSMGRWATASEGGWSGMLTGLICLITVVGALCLALFWWMNRVHGPEVEEAEEPQKEKIKVKSVLDALRMVLRSRILVCIAIMIIAEYVAFNLVEVLWKEQMVRLYPDPALFCTYTGKVLRWTGLLGIISSLFISGNVIRFSGWTAAALLTPFILAITSAAFFLFTFIQGDSVATQLAVATVGAAPMTLAVFFGAAHNCLSRSSRQAFADPAKEMAYLPLPSELQTQGKTFVDGACPTIGKTGGALIQQGLLLISPNLLATAPIAAVLVFLATAAAIGSVLAVGKGYRQALSASTPPSALPATA